MFFYLSLGSNVDAESSSVTMLRMLCEHFGHLAVFPFRYTEPEGIDSDRDFVNSLVILWCDQPKIRVKQTLNQIEVTMGRDRSDPLRSVKARCADIDILACSYEFDTRAFDSTNEPYVKACLDGEGTSADLSPWGLPSYQRTSTVHLDAVSGDIRVIEDECHGFKHWVETTFKGQ